MVVPPPNPHVPVSSVSTTKDRIDEQAQAELSEPVVDAQGCERTRKRPHGASWRRFFNNRDFRALSVALNRGQMNEIVFFGLGDPHPATPLNTMEFFDQAWYNDNLAYDPDRTTGCSTPSDSTNATATASGCAWTTASGSTW